MTTVIVIKGKDPESLESYVIMCADSVGSINDRPVSWNEKKIFAGDNSNYVIGTAGRTLDNYFLKGSHPEVHSFLNKQQYMQKKNVEKMLFNINSELSESFGEANNFVASFVDVVPEMYIFKDDKLEPMLFSSYAVIGSGAKYASSLDALKLYKQEDKRIWLPKKTLIDAALNTLINISSKDDCTGGYMDAAIVTPLKGIFLPNYARIKSDKDSITKTYDKNMSDVDEHLSRTGQFFDED